MIERYLLQGLSYNLSISDGAQSRCKPLLRRVCFLEILVTLLKKMGGIYRTVSHEDDCKSVLDNLCIFFTIPLEDSTLVLLNKHAIVNVCMRKLLLHLD